MQAYGARSFSTAPAAGRWAEALARTGELVQLAAPDGEVFGATWVKLKSLSSEPLIASADGARYEARLSPLLLPAPLLGAGAARLASAVLERAGGEILRAHGALGAIRQARALIAYRLSFAGNG